MELVLLLVLIAVEVQSLCTSPSEYRIYGQGGCVTLYADQAFLATTVNGSVVGNEFTLNNAHFFGKDTHNQSYHCPSLPPASTPCKNTQSCGPVILANAIQEYVPPSANGTEHKDRQVSASTLEHGCIALPSATCEKMCEDKAALKSKCSCGSGSPSPFCSFFSEAFFKLPDPVISTFASNAKRAACNFYHKEDNGAVKLPKPSVGKGGEVVWSTKNFKFFSPTPRFFYFPTRTASMPAKALFSKHKFIVDFRDSIDELDETGKTKFPCWTPFVILIPESVDSSWEADAEINIYPEWMRRHVYWVWWRTKTHPVSFPLSAQGNVLAPWGEWSPKYITKILGTVVLQSISGKKNRNYGGSISWGAPAVPSTCPPFVKQQRMSLTICDDKYPYTPQHDAAYRNISLH